MTPLEKALELSERFSDDITNTTGIFKAMICVEYLIDCTHSEDIVMEQIGVNGYDENKKYTYEYWKDVKTELEKL